MLSPAGRMSDVQRAQMYSLADPNIHNIAVEGVFDDCQNLVKAVNADTDFKARYSSLSLSGENKPTPTNYAQLLEQIKPRPDHELIQTMLLRSMSQAVYSADNTLSCG